jgi:hypothetical protein
VVVRVPDGAPGAWLHACADELKELPQVELVAWMAFEVEGRLFRPAQDCSRRYGEAVVINRVDVLTPEAYFETPVARIAPDPAGPYPHGLHTVSAAGEWTLIDGKRERRSLRGLLPLLRRARR